jgi:hypothetical protein
MKKCIKSLIIGGFAFFLIPISIYAAVSIPFGGKVIFQKPCDLGMALTVQTAKGPMNYFWFYGNLPYLSRMVPRINQNMVGMAKPVPVPCTISGVTYSKGLPILYHGASF